MFFFYVYSVYPSPHQALLHYNVFARIPQFTFNILMTQPTSQLNPCNSILNVETADMSSHFFFLICVWVNNSSNKIDMTSPQILHWYWSLAVVHLLRLSKSKKVQDSTHENYITENFNISTNFSRHIHKNKLQKN